MQAYQDVQSRMLDCNSQGSGGGRGRQVWGAQTLCGGVSAKVVGKRHVKGSHNITSHFSIYHASPLYSYKIKEVFSVISPGG